MADIIVRQFEIESDAKGSARAAAQLTTDLGDAAAEYVLGTATYKRESGSAFLVIVTSASAMTQNGAASLANAHVVAVTAEIESAGAANLASAINAAVTAAALQSPPVVLSKFVSLTVNNRTSGSSYATALLAS